MEKIYPPRRVRFSAAATRPRDVARETSEQGVTLAEAQTWKPPADSQRCPSKWGAGDERGSANHMKPETLLRGVRLIKSGETIELAHVLNAAMPFFGTRRFDVHTKRTFMNQPS